MKYFTIAETVEFTGKSESTVKRFYRKVKEGSFEGQVDPNDLHEAFKMEEYTPGRTRMIVSQLFIENYFAFSKQRSNQRDEMHHFLKEELQRKGNQIDRMQGQIDSYLEMEQKVLDMVADLQKQNAILLQQNNQLVQTIQGTNEVNLTPHKEIEEVSYTEEIEDTRSNDPANEPLMTSQKKLAEDRQKVLMEKALKEGMTFGEWMSVND